MRKIVYESQGIQEQALKEAENKMSTVVIRSNKGNDDLIAGIKMTDKKRLRIREYLVSVGIQVDRLQPLIWPEGAVSAYKEYMYAPWEYTTKADILRQKRQRRRTHRIWMESRITHRRRLYVWVFWCPGVGGFAFRGWWTYIIGCGVEYGGKLIFDTEPILQAMRLFPVIEPTLFEEDWEQRERWMIEFAKRYQRGLWCGKPQGKALIWAEVRGSTIIKILGRAQWHPRSGVL